MNTNPLLRATARPKSSVVVSLPARSAAYGVPAGVLGVKSYSVDQGASYAGVVRPAGNPDAIDDLMNTLATNPSHQLTDADLARISGESGATPELPSDTTVDNMSLEERRLVEARNTALINAGAAAINQAGTIITDAITSGSRERIATIEAQSRLAVAQALAQARSASTPQEAADAQQRASDAASLQQLMLQLLAGQRQPQPTGMSTGTMVALGVGAVVIVGLGVALVMSMRGPRRNPRGYAEEDMYEEDASRANPVVGRGKRRHFVNAATLRKGRGKRRHA